MKNFKSILPLLALVLAISLSAFTVKENAPSTSSIQLHWYEVVNGNLHYDGFSTKQDEMVLTDCEDNSSIVCARGYTEEQLVDGDPQKGPIEVTQVEDVIFKTLQ